MPGVRVEVAGVHQVDGIWPIVAEGLEVSCRRTGGDCTSEYLWSECRSGRAFLVVVIRDEAVIAACVMRFEAWTSGKKLRCLALYGTGMKDWLSDLLRTVSGMARVGGATALVSEGRKGWERVFRRKARLLRSLYEVEL